MSYSEALATQLRRLRSQSLHAIEREVAQKRREWIARRTPAREQVATPRAGFELFCFDYLGLDPADVPIVAESDSEIVWQSRNPCPTLEACQLLGLDTRTVCRGAYEKSTQAFLSALDPRLRFLRSYEDIRPHGNSCLERIVLVDFDQMMSVALGEARISLHQGNKGYGAVVALGERILAQAHDLAATAGDPSLHAELLAIRHAAGVLQDPNLSGTILFSTCEPCPMCASLAVWANVTTIVYGESIDETAAMGRTRIRIGAEEIGSKSPVMIEVIGGVLRERCRALYE